MHDEGDRVQVDLEHVDSPELSFRETGPDYRWVSGHRFVVNSAGTCRELLGALVANAWYDHSYAEPTPSRPKAGKRIHGPYRLDAITSTSFVETDRGDTIQRLETWASKYDGVSEDFLAKFRAFIDDLIPAEHVVFELPDLPLSARHEWGWVLGVDGFLEFIAISPDRSRLNLLVASDD